MKRIVDRADIRTALSVVDSAPPTPSGRPHSGSVRRRWSIIAIALALVASASASAQGPGSPGNWTMAGFMHTAREYHTATLLDDGRVLVAGGDNSVTGFNSAELYDPATGRWDVTGSMSNVRSSHTATRLRSGLVLVAGGCCDGTGVQNLATAELYHPRSGTWAATGSMTTPRVYHTASLLHSGQVLVTGGCGLENCYPLLASAELYDPRSGAWTATGSMTTPREYHTATVLQSGLVLIAGGYGGACCNRDLNSAELYDPATGAFRATGSLHTARENHTATLLPDGRVLVAGGCGDDYCNTVLSSAEIYDPATGTWSTTGSMAAARVHFTATLLPSGKVLAVGGFYATASAELYDPASGTWTATGSMAKARYNHAAALLTDGQVLVSGGISSCGETGCNTRASAEVYTP